MAKPSIKMGILLPKNQLIIVGIFQIILGSVESSFIDTSSPLIITEKLSSEDSCFGFSLLGVNTQNLFGEVVSKLYIGAPKESVRISARDVDSSGFVWECDLSLDKDKISCRHLSNQKFQSPESCPVGSRRYLPESQEMWMGGTISGNKGSQDNFLTCGHRWKTRINSQPPSYRGQKGLCYLRDVRNPDRTVVLKPHFDQEDIQELLQWDTSLGFSASFDANNRFLVGAPSFKLWIGAVVSYDVAAIRNKAHDANCGYAIPTGGYIIKPASQDQDSYFGYAITSGNYLYPNQPLFAVGAPRGQETGFKGFLQGYVMLVDGNIRVRGRVLPQVFGDEADLGSYFGSVLASADINGDGLDDLLVGAPMYTETLDSFEQGCVYVYTARGGTGRLLRELKLLGKGESGSRFGSAVANLGDVNYDGISDIAISSPGADNGKGSVLIYYGSSSGLDTQTVLEIHASKIDPGLTGLGSSLYGNIDLDGNQTPDIVIGSHESKRVVLLRTRPKVTLNMTMEYSIQKFKQMDRTFTVTLCIWTERTPKFDGVLSITLRGQVDSKVSEGKERFHFSENDQRVLERNVKVPESVNECVELSISIKLVQELTANDNKNIHFSWSLNYNDTKDLPDVVSNVDITDVRGLPTRILGSRKFCSNCPAATSSLFESFLHLANDNCDLDKDPICTPDLEISTSFQVPKSDLTAVRENEYMIGSADPVVFVVNVTNNGETAYRPTIQISTNISSIKLVKATYRSRHDCEQKQGKPLHAGRTFLYECAVPLHTGKTIQLEFSFDFNQRAVYNFTEEVVVFTVTSQPLSAAKDSRYKAVKLKLLTDYNLSLVASMKSPIIVNVQSGGGNNFLFISSFFVRNSGITPLDGSQLDLVFKIPVYRRVGQKNGQRVFKVGNPTSPKINCKTLDPLGFDSLNEEQGGNNNGRNHITFPSSNGSIQTTIQENPTPVKRNRRSNPPVANAQKESSATGKSFEIDCGDSSNWACIEVSCKPNVQVTIKELLDVDLRLRFNPNTLFADKLIPEDTDSIIFKVDGRGTAEIANAIKIDQRSLESSSISQLKLFVTNELPAWLIFVSGVGGLVLFLLITFGLFKCGFFRRKVKEDLVALKAKTEEQEIMAKAFPSMPTEN